MTAATQTSSFLNSALARLLALIIAILLVLLIWISWGPQIMSLFSGETGNSAQQSSTDAVVQPENSALQACLEQRVGDVEQMKEEGTISEGQYAKFRSRAESLCRAQNPGS